MTRVLICGGGLSGSLAAVALARRRPDVEILLVEAGKSFGGNHTWSFFDSDVGNDCRWLVDTVASHRWPDHEVRFTNRHRILPLGYNSILSHDLDTTVRSTLSSGQYRLGCTVSEIGPTYALAGGERLEADCVIDARGLLPMPRLDLGWQKFMGRVYRFPREHRVVRPVIMDATIPQIDGYRFAYLLPMSSRDLLVEDTYYSSSHLLHHQTLGDRLDALAEKVAGERGEVTSEERGVLPVVISGELEDLWPRNDLVPRLGVAGGFFHPTTGYSLPDALENAVLLAGERDLSAPAIALRLRSRAQRLWRQRRFFQLLNRMMFKAADETERYRILEHFYRLPPCLIARFYAAKLTSLDKLRIVTGRPPVPIGRALSALIGKAA